MADNQPATGLNDAPSPSEQERDIRWAKVGVLFFGGLALGGLLLYAIQYIHSGKFALICGILGSGLLLACASFGLGSLLGFIFAIPRALQKTGDQAQADDRPLLGYQVNTNLEQISDWLTKILVGVGLVQLERVPEYAKRLGNYFSNCLGGAPCSPAAAVSIIVVFLVNGFLAGYLITRLYVTGALKRAEIEQTRVESPENIAITTKDVAGPG